MQTVLDLSFTKARQYFLESENYCNMNLPKYIEFGDILSFVQKQRIGRHIGKTKSYAF